MATGTDGKMKRRHCIGFQIVEIDTDNPPKSMKTFEIFPLDFCLDWIHANDPKCWRLLPIFSNDVDGPTFPMGKPDPIT
jgi:hypothetical protein